MDAVERLPVDVEATVSQSRTGPWWHLPWGSILIITAMVFVAVLAPLLTLHSPVEQSLPDRLLPPAWQDGGSPKYPLGTDMFGRDLLTRLFYGARVSLVVAAALLA